MDIKWHGLSCFTIKGKTGAVVTDPYDPKAVGLGKSLKAEGDIVLCNVDFETHHAVEQLGEKVSVFDWPGEYEAKSIIFQGIPAYDRPREKDESKKDDAERVIIYTIKMDGFKICHLSNLGHKLTPEMLEVIGDTDILLVPIGGAGCLDAVKAHEVIEQIDPRVVIPMYYKVDGMKTTLSDESAFLKEVGLSTPEREKIAKFSAPSALPQDSMVFKILEPVL